LQQGLALYDEELAWRQRAANELLAPLSQYDNTLKGTVGARLQERMSDEQAEYVAGCLADHKDISLAF